jgi:hypothetical protein
VSELVERARKLAEEHEKGGGWRHVVAVGDRRIASEGPLTWLDGLEYTHKVAPEVVTTLRALASKVERLGKLAVLAEAYFLAHTAHQEARAALDAATVGMEVVGYEERYAKEVDANLATLAAETEALEALVAYAGEHGAG